MGVFSAAVGNQWSPIQQQMHDHINVKQESYRLSSTWGALAITPTSRPWTYTSDDSYFYQLSLVLATATVSLKQLPGICLTYLSDTSDLDHDISFFFSIYLIWSMICPFSLSDISDLEHDISDPSDLSKLDQDLPDISVRSIWSDISV